MMTYFNSVLPSRLEPYSTPVQHRDNKIRIHELPVQGTVGGKKRTLEKNSPHLRCAATAWQTRWLEFPDQTVINT